MPGTVLSIKVAVGDTVNSGDVLMILEAMKMENEIMAPAAGKVAAISVAEGASVNGGDVLIVIE
jgi:biotin carboxyl carrier protein